MHDQLNMLRDDYKIFRFMYSHICESAVCQELLPVTTTDPATSSS